MRAAFATTGENAKQAGAGTGNVIAVSGSIQPILLEFLKATFPRKTWALVAELLGSSDSVARKRIAGEREFSADDLAQMLRSERGFEVLAAVMADARPKWWRVCAPLMEVSDIRKMQIAAQRRLASALKGAVDADTDLSAAIARAEAFSDQDFMRPHVDALSSIGGVPHRAVAKTTK